VKVALYYPVLYEGGCEKRLGELARWLLDNGDDVYIVAISASRVKAGEDIICRRCGFPRERIITKPLYDTRTDEEFITNVIGWMRPDVIDCQWHGPWPNVTLPIVYTMHGAGQLVPNKDIAAVISVEDLPDGHAAYRVAPVHVVWNWVDTKRFQFVKALGSGVAFFGRAFKMIPNVMHIARKYPTVQIDAYGFGPVPALPDNVVWHGYVDPLSVIYSYRVVFASAQAALEAIAAGRLVICGHAQDNRKPLAALALPHNIQLLSRSQMWSSKGSGAPDFKQLKRDFETARKNNLATERAVLRRYIEEYHDLDTQCRKIREIYETVVRK